jgi:Mn-containing catalase
LLQKKLHGDSVSTMEEFSVGDEFTVDAVGDVTADFDDEVATEATAKKCYSRCC